LIPTEFEDHNNDLASSNDNCFEEADLGGDNHDRESFLDENGRDLANQLSKSHFDRGLISHYSSSQ
jgi:hypothetical protein